MTADEFKAHYDSLQQNNGLLGGLMGAYGAYTNGNDTLDQIAKSSSNADQQISGLQDLYSPNGAAGTAMKEAVMRQAAARGRNSQVGTNYANWAAQLAPHQAQTAQAIQGLNSQRAQLQQQASQVKAQQLGAAYNLGNQFLQSPIGQKATDWAGGQLKDLWNQYGPQDPQGGNTSNYSGGNIDARGGYGSYAPDPGSPMPYQGVGTSGAGDWMGSQEPTNYSSGMNTNTSPTDWTNADWMN